MTRIIYAKLKNMAGIYNGTGKTEIELDFSKSQNRVVILAGENGSGKSTIQSMLHPFAETMDKRTDIVMKGKNGFKEIRIEHEGSTYKIEHHYNRSGKNRIVKSFIAKWAGGHWDELNENGNVTSFKEIVSQELDTDENLFRLLFIGSNVDGFIKMKTAERKKFMSKFLPDIEEYLYYYKIASERYTDLKRKIQIIADDMKKLDTEERMLSLLEGATSQIEAREERRDKLKAAWNKGVGRISQMDPDGSIQSKHDKLEEDRKTFESRSLAARRGVEKMVDSFPKLAEYDTAVKASKAVAATERKVDAAAAEVKSLTADKKRLASEVVSLGNDLAEKGLELAKYKTEKNLEEYIELREKYEARIKEIKREIKRDYSDLAGVRASVEELDRYESVMRTLFSKIEKVSAANQLSDIEAVLAAGADRRPFQDRLSGLIAETDELREELDGHQRKVSFYAGKADMSDVLEMRPGNCKINSCGFIAEALKNKDAGKHKEKYERLADKAREGIAAIQADRETAEARLVAFDEFQRIWEYVSDNAETIALFPMGKDFESRESLAGAFLRNKDRYVDTSRLRELIYLRAERAKIESEVMPDILRNIELLESKAGIIKTLQKDIARIEAKVSEVRTELAEVTDALSEQTRRQAAFSSLLKRFSDYAELMEELESIDKETSLIVLQFQEIADKMTTIVTLREKNDAMAQETEDIDDELGPLRKEQDRIKFNIEKLREYTARKADLDSNLANVSAVRDALSPTKGIPLLFIEVYLRQTKTIANRMLDIAWGGKFFLDSFELTDKDFFIRAKKDSGELVEDISLTSQGEQALSGIALSMALMQQAMRKYNVMSLDEIDAELDAKNRRSFVDIMDQQMDELGIEQVFIITHNREFDSYPVDLILMPNHGLDITNKAYMTGKNIIFNHAS